MNLISELYWNDPAMLSFAIGAMLVALISIMADRRRQKRKRADDVGFMPWTAITVFALLVAIMCTAITLHGG